MFIAVAIAAVLVWYLFGVVLLAFAALILATFVRLCASPFDAIGCNFPENVRKTSRTAASHGGESE
jgi:hypothetical protein